MKISSIMPFNAFTFGARRKNTQNSASNSLQKPLPKLSGDVVELKTKPRTAKKRRNIVKKSDSNLNQQKNSRGISAIRLPKEPGVAMEKIKGKTSDQILEMSGISVVQLSKKAMNTLTKGKGLGPDDKVLTEFFAPSTLYRYSDIGVKEEDLLEGVTAVTGNFILRNSDLKKTNVRFIGGDLAIGTTDSAIEDLSSIERVGHLIIVEAKNEEKAIQALKDRKFNFEILEPQNKIINIPLNTPGHGKPKKAAK